MRMQARVPSSKMIDRRVALVLALAAVVAFPRRRLQWRSRNQRSFASALYRQELARSSPHWVAFAQRLAELGYVDGKNISIEFRSAEGKPERFPGLMAEMVRLGVDVILPVGPEASLRAAKEANDGDPHRRGGH